jgi:ATP-dependent DNA helicase RecG
LPADLSTPLRYVKGVGPRRAADLERVGLTTVEDLLLRFPLRYEDRAALLTIGALRPGHVATVIGQVLDRLRSTRRPVPHLRSPSATPQARFVVFPNQAFLKDVFHTASRWSFSVPRVPQRLQFTIRR